VHRTNQFRGITISPVISKVFEHCLLFIYKDHLVTSDRQFGFKKHTSCAQAIFVVRKVIEHYVNNGSTVNVCCLDVSKAFDKVNHFCLFSKLMNINAPVELINILRNWYSKSFSFVKWGNTLCLKKTGPYNNVNNLRMEVPIHSPFGAPLGLPI
jgi:hypothetical protein